VSHEVWKVDFEIYAFWTKSSTFWGIPDDYKESQIFGIKFDRFRTKNEDDGCLTFSEYLKLRKSEVDKKHFEDQVPKVSQNSIIGILDRLKKGPVNEDSKTEDQQKQSPKVHLGFLICSTILQATDKIEEDFRAFDKLSKDKPACKLLRQMEMFRKWFSVNVSRGFFVELSKTISSLCAEITQSGACSIISQYDFLMMVKLTSAALETIERLGISLKSILSEEQDYSTFKESLNKLVETCADILDVPFVEQMNASTIPIDQQVDDVTLLTLKEVEVARSECLKYYKSLNLRVMVESLHSKDTLAERIDSLARGFDNYLHLSYSDQIFFEYLSMESTMETILNLESPVIIEKLFLLIEKVWATFKLFILSELCKYTTVNLGWLNRIFYEVSLHDMNTLVIFVG